MNWVRRKIGRNLWRRVAYGAAATLCVTLLGCEHESSSEWMKLTAELKVEIARTPEETRRGLKFRQSLPRDEGMFFVFDEEEQRSFYMRDTRVPLSIAFIKSGGVIESIADMIPLDERSVSSAGPVKFALEAKRGWFDDNGIGPGDKVVLEGNRVSFFRKIGR